MADENNSNEDGQFVPDGSMEPLSPQEADNTDYGLMVGERVQKKDPQQEMRESYLAYAMSVIVDRALPDVRDGMKPVHRRVIYAMYDGGYRPDRGYSKCARVVGEVMGKYHPHGDSAIYDTLVRMAQSWSMRYTLVDGRGNFGSPATTRQPQCVTRNAVWRRSPWKWCVTSTRTPSISCRTTMARRRSRPCCRPASRTCCATARPASPSAWRPTFLRTTCARWQKACIGRSTIRTRAVRNCSTT